MMPEPLEDFETPAALIAIRPKFAQRILSGEKKFELRTFVGVDFYPGMIVVMYVSGTVKSIIGEFRVGQVFKGRPEKIWGKLMEWGDTGVGDEDYVYIARARKAMALQVEETLRYARPVSLSEVRAIIPGWNPPMSATILNAGDPLWEMVIKPLREYTLQTQRFNAQRQG